ncbi:beta-1,4 N-acetylgalactosaminyltransferase 2 isoform X2 [Trichosurus vulpecula]|uniref:beta-1,4 N-acetylgalactosaminyltransferase 2 isoform X2 n=1 Tax=Trichosurus vulpecula TaxID=9337 RepID=UPI00186AF341|nr:beta-1,4 N-acetylgalactosaminyltransferase 2 isoform X2 [Trichosurus vulpecula]
MTEERGRGYGHQLCSLDSMGQGQESCWRSLKQWLHLKWLLVFCLLLICGLLQVFRNLQESQESLLKSKFPPPFALKLLSQEELRKLFNYDGLWLFPQRQCECEKQSGNYIFQESYNKSELEAVKIRRKAEFEHFQRREGLPHPPPLLAQPNIPFGYPVHGVEVMPLHTILIPGLKFDGTEVPLYKVTLKASLGTLNTLADTPDNEVLGRGQKQLTVLTPSKNRLNFILQHVTYTSTIYQSGAMDIVSIGFGSSVAKFPVNVNQPTIPKLFDPGPERKLRNLVTIATKTFLRPHKLKILLKSIREYYPDVTVIVADDSEKPEKIDDIYVEHYIMPFGKGWFAGRNLAVSQVSTKYVLWVDDDFLFTKMTKIEALVDVLEKTELDVVGGSVSGNMFQFKLLMEQGEDGDCIHKRSGHFQALDGFPNCVVTSGVVNFFLAHTERLQRVGFDPRLQRVAHTEFFIDGLGILRVGSCSNVIVNHQSHTPASDSDQAALEKAYSRFRTNTQNQVKFKLALHYFKNHLQCYTQR